MGYFSSSYEAELQLVKAT